MMKTLYYIHDPMCSWCWGFDQTWKQLQAHLPSSIIVKRLLGGLAPDSDQPMPEAMQQHLIRTWQRISEQIPGVRFNFDYWQTCRPRRSTYPACRAVIAAREQGPQYDIAMTEAIQQAYYLHALNPSDESTLIELAVSIGLDQDSFIRTLQHPDTQALLIREIEQSRAMQVDSFPALVLHDNQRIWRIPIHYNDFQPMLELIQQVEAL